MVSFDLTGKVAVITGGNGGLGLDIARGYVDFGAEIAILARNMEKAAAAKKELEERAPGRKIGIYACDVAVEDSVEQAVSAALADFGKIDILVNNAGVGAIGGKRIERAEEQTFEQWRITMDTDVFGVFKTSVVVYEKWMKAHGGKIVNMASTGGIKGAPLSVAYNTAKAGVIMLTQVLAMAWAKEGVFVNAISPGMIISGMGDKTPQARIDNFTRKIPMGRCGNHEDMQGAAIFLASDANTYCQGINIVVDGGLLLPLD